MLQKIFRRFFHDKKEQEAYLEKTRQQAKEIILKANEETLKLKSRR